MTRGAIGRADDKYAGFPPKDGGTMTSLDEGVSIERPSSIVLEEKEKEVGAPTEVVEPQTASWTGANGFLPPVQEDAEQPSPGKGYNHESAEHENHRSHRWSISAIRKQFQDVQIEELYVRYWLRLQRVLLFKLLIVIAVYGMILLIFYNIPHQQSTSEQSGDPPDELTQEAFSQPWGNIALCVALLIATLCMILVLIRDLFFKFYKLISFLVWLFLLALLYAFTSLAANSKRLKPMDGVPMTFYTIFVIHTMLPTRRRYAFLLGLLTALVDIVFVGVLYHPPSLEWKLRPLFANVVIYLCANLTGFYHKHLTDLAHRHTFWESRKYIEANIRYSRKREKQMQMKEALLLKVIPKHLLEDMKKITYNKIVAMGKVAEEQGSRFYNLYVDRHDDVRIVRKRPFPRMFLGKGSKVMHIRVNPKRKKNVFRELLLFRADDVSILYADIVNFTPLTVKLGSNVLVEVLNQLFGRFDSLSKENQCMRIKMLGDCYYCVSGLPDPVEGHARNCVIMGLQMIHVIRHFREETGVENLDMRIGINSGFVLSGVLGLKKWQYDVWSDDVTVANHMESAGEPGKVHITRATYEQLGDEFEVIPGEGASRSPYLKENNVETFFIKDSEVFKVSLPPLKPKPPLQTDKYKELSSSFVLLGLTLAKLNMTGVMNRMKSVKSPHRANHMPSNANPARRMSVAECVEHWGAEKPFDSLSDYMMERTFPEMTEVNHQLERGFSLNRSRRTEDETKGMGRYVADIHPVTLRFQDKNLEREYEHLRDSSFKFYTTCAFIIFLFMATVQILIITKNEAIYATMVAIGVCFVSLIVFTTDLKCLPFYPHMPVACMRWLHTVTEVLISNKWCKVAMSGVSCALIFVASILPPVLNCQLINDDLALVRTTENTTSLIALQNITDPGINTNVTTTRLPEQPNVTEPPITFRCGSDNRCCMFAPYYLFSCMLALISCSVFLRIPHVIKSIYMVIGLTVFNIMFYEVFSAIFRLYDDLIKLDFLQTSVRGTLYTTVLCVTLIVLDRQIGSNLRLDFLCKVRIQHEKDEVQRNDKVNQILMDNILPRHVAEHFTRPVSQRANKHAMYHERCTDACVMFAAIPNFNLKTFFSSVDVTGKESLRLLNEIISAFDVMLMLKPFHGVEKIKTIGSTYMAAAGLHDCDDYGNSDKATSLMLLMVRFATAMIKKLEPISRDAFGNYQLRIGINYGDVVAGVVGAQKPQYDIWGDVVNVASRMESHGVIGKIQVPYPAAKLLMAAGIQCEYRGHFPVKGKDGLMGLYVVEESKVQLERFLSTISADSTQAYL